MIKKFIDFFKTRLKYEYSYNRFLYNLIYNNTVDINTSRYGTCHNVIGYYKKITLYDSGYYCLIYDEVSRCE